MDDELRKALRRTDPPPGFADRVLAQLDQPRRFAPVRPPQSRFSPVPKWALAAACMVMAVLGAARYEQQQQEARNASQQLRLALQIASGKLAVAQRKVMESSQ